MAVAIKTPKFYGLGPYYAAEKRREQVQRETLGAPAINPAALAAERYGELSAYLGEARLARAEGRAQTELEMKQNAEKRAERGESVKGMATMASFGGALGKGVAAAYGPSSYTISPAITGAGGGIGGGVAPAITGETIGVLTAEEAAAQLGGALATEGATAIGTSAATSGFTALGTTAATTGGTTAATTAGTSVGGAIGGTVAGGTSGLMIGGGLMIPFSMLGPIGMVLGATIGLAVSFATGNK